jgi:hypothetical protein
METRSGTDNRAPGTPHSHAQKRRSAAALFCTLHSNAASVFSHEQRVRENQSTHACVVGGLMVYSFKEGTDSGGYGLMDS